MKKSLASVVLVVAASFFAMSQMPTSQNANNPSAPMVDCTAYPASGTSLYILPYEVGQSYEVWRTVEHYSPGNRGVGLYAIDLRMPIGTKIVASREGKVVAVQESYFDGNGEDLKENLVFIQHADGTVARYFHLTHDGALVNVGDAVKQGQVIALSGNTGDSAGPHLHFDVQGCGPNLNPNYNRFPCAQTLPVTFRNAEENSCGLVSSKSYKAANFTPNTEASSLEADKLAITQTALDYIEGWYNGEVGRMQRALHPELAKRITNTNAAGANNLVSIGAMTLVQQTQAGLGRSIPKERRQKDIAILDVYQNAASVKIVASDWIDYLHLTKFNGRWVIVNVLWGMKPKDK